MNLKELLQEIKDQLAALVGVTGRETQKKRWHLRRNERIALGMRIRKRKGSLPGCYGAFGKRPVIDPRPALKPAEMRERAAAKREKAA